MAREELFIGGVYIPLSKSINASLTKSITDVEKPQDRKATYSKTTSVPNSKEAQLVFGGLFELNIVDSTFNPNAKISCRYIVDGELIISGYCQLKSIKTTSRTDIEYDIVMFSALANIFKDMGENYLVDLKDELAEWNHPFTKEVQAYSWETQVYNSVSAGYVPFEIGKGYVYPLIDYGFSTDLVDFNFKQVPCALYLKEYIDAIFSFTGKTYTSTFFNSDYFKRHIIPSSPSSFQLTAAEINGLQFKANTPTLTSTGTTTSSNLPINTLSVKDPIIFGTEISDPNNVYNNTNGEYTIISASYQGVYDINALVEITANFTPSTGVAVKAICEVDGYLMVFLNGAQIMAKPFYLTSDDATFFSGTRSTTPSPTTYEDLDYLAEKKFSNQPFNPTAVGRPGDNVPNRYLISVNGVQLNDTDVITVEWKAGLYGKTSFSGFGVGMFEDASAVEYTGTATIDISVGAYYNKVVNTYPSAGSTLKIEKIIPKDVKQKDFFKSIISRYNLWVDINPNDPNNYIIEPRDEFLTNDVINIQSQLDQSQALTITPMGKTDITEYLFSDKPDKDYLNVTYTAKHQDRVYGDRHVINTNDYTSKKQTISTIFSPTPLAAPANSDRVLSTILQKDELGYPLPIDHNIRILYYGGLKSGKYWRHIENIGFAQIPFPTTYTTYPYAGHFDDPFSASEDINFGLVQEVYYDDNLQPIAVTDNNLVNKYYSTMLQEYTNINSKIVKGMFNVTPSDFKNWDFRKLYWFEDAYFRLQEINNYNPTGESLTECTFLYLTGVPSFTASVIGLDGDDVPFTPDNTGGGTVVLTEGTPSKGTRTSEQPDGNNTTKRGVDVQGKYNYVAYDAHYIKIQGDKNQVWSEAKDIDIQGDNNIIDGGVKNVTLINSNDLHITESDVTYINNRIVTNMAGMPTDVKSIRSSQDVEVDVITYELDTTSNNITMDFNLTTTTFTEGQIWYFKKDAIPNIVTIQSTGGTIDDAATAVLVVNKNLIGCQYDGGTNFILL